MLSIKIETNFKSNDDDILKDLEPTNECYLQNDISITAGAAEPDEGKASADKIVIDDDEALGTITTDNNVNSIINSIADLIPLKSECDDHQTVNNNTVDKYVIQSIITNVTEKIGKAEVINSSMITSIPHINELNEKRVVDKDIDDKDLSASASITTEKNTSSVNNSKNGMIIEAELPSDISDLETKSTFVIGLDGEDAIYKLITNDSAVIANSDNSNQLSTTHATPQLKRKNDDSNNEETELNTTIKKPKLLYHKRPENWREINNYYKLTKSTRDVRKMFPEMNLDNHGNVISESCLGMRMLRWAKNINEETKSGSEKKYYNSNRMPPYGIEIDLALLNDVKEKAKCGIPINWSLLRELLVVHLAKENLLHLLIENDGHYAFGSQWAHRFFKRHKISYKLSDITTTATTTHNKNTTNNTSGTVITNNNSSSRRRSSSSKKTNIDNNNPTTSTSTTSTTATITTSDISLEDSSEISTTVITDDDYAALLQKASQISTPQPLSLSPQPPVLPNNNSNTDANDSMVVIQDRSKDSKEESDDIESESIIIEKINKPKMFHSKRPENWREITNLYKLTKNTRGIRKVYPDMNIDKHGKVVSESCLGMRMLRWTKDLEEEIRVGSQKQSYNANRMPPYGSAIDLALLQDVRNRVNQGLDISWGILRELLLVRLKDNNLLHLTIEHGGQYAFKAQWAYRFFKRNKITHIMVDEESSNSAITSRKKSDTGTTFDNSSNTSTTEGVSDNVSSTLCIPVRKRKRASNK